MRCGMIRKGEAGAGVWTGVDEGVILQMVRKFVKRAMPLVDMSVHLTRVYNAFSCVNDHALSEEPSKLSTSLSAIIRVPPFAAIQRFLPLFPSPRPPPPPDGITLAAGQRASACGEALGGHRGRRRLYHGQRGCTEGGDIELPR